MRRAKSLQQQIVKTLLPPLKVGPRTPPEVHPGRLVHPGSISDGFGARNGPPRAGSEEKNTKVEKNIKIFEPFFLGRGPPPRATRPPTGGASDVPGSPATPPLGRPPSARATRTTTTTTTTVGALNKVHLFFGRGSAAP